MLTILRMFIAYRPLAFFASPGAVFGVAGLIAGIRFLDFYALGSGQGHVQSVVFSALCILAGLILFVMGLIGDLIATNRKLLYRVDLRLQHLEHHEK